MLHCVKKFGPTIARCPLGEGIECLTVIQTFTDRIQATACMLDESCTAWVHSSSDLEIIVADLGVPPRVDGWPGGWRVSENNDP